jgi:23S rRNA pseudouridine2605 synthase
MKERLQKVLARAGYGSRRVCEELIRSGRVKMNGEIAQLGDRADLAHDNVLVDGKTIEDAEGLVYILLNKPRGYLSSTRSQGRNPTVLRLVPTDTRIYPVGRLDLHSEGLLLMTNDGNLTNRLTHPRYEHEKEYRVLLNRKPDKEQLQQWRRGVVLPDGYKTKPLRIKDSSSSRDGFWINIIMTEGRKRQIRETADILGLGVLRLIRIRLASLHLGDLPVGEWRWLGQAEIERLERL